ncbi:MAG: hypothetical protein EHM58_17725, partial [Ignavibacteriae bacterium]
MNKLIKIILIILFSLPLQFLSQTRFFGSGDRAYIYHDVFGNTYYTFGYDENDRHNIFIQGPCVIDNFMLQEYTINEAIKYIDNEEYDDAKIALMKIILDIDKSFNSDIDNMIRKRNVNASFELLKNIYYKEKDFRNALLYNELEYSSFKNMSRDGIENLLNYEKYKSVNSYKSSLDRIIFNESCRCGDFTRLNEYNKTLTEFSAKCHYEMKNYNTVITITSGYLNDTAMAEMFVKSMIKKFKSNPLKEELSKEMKTLTIMPPEDTATVFINKDADIPFNGSININLFNVPVKITDNKISKLQSDFRQNKITYLEAN